MNNTKLNSFVANGRANVEFVGSYLKLSQMPDNNLPELAIIGRSNAGKSSLINTLFDAKKLARTSKTPGRTESLNFFLIEKLFYIVDSPGYGYAKTSSKIRESWFRQIEKYFIDRKQLVMTLLLIDSRRGIMPKDKEIIEFFDYYQISYKVIYTKADLVKQSEIQNGIIATSSKNGKGITEVRRLIIDHVMKSVQAL